MIEPNLEPDNAELANALRRLRESSSGLAGASDSLEASLTQAFRAEHGRNTAMLRKRAWAPAAIAATLLLASVPLTRMDWRTSPPAVAPAPPAPRIAATVRPPVAPADHERIVVKPKPARRVPRVKAVETPVPPARVEDFVVIPYAPPFTPYDSGQVVRVNMRGSSVRRLGLPVSMDRVQADVLLGNDGIARAIRLVSNSGLN